MINETTFKQQLMAQADGKAEYLYFISSAEGDKVIKEILHDQKELKQLREVRDKLQKAKDVFRNGDELHRAVFKMLVEITEGVNK